MYQWLYLLAIVVSTTVSYDQIGHYDTYRCTQSMFTLHCAATETASVMWTRCANNQCKVIYQRNTNQIAVRNRHVLGNGTLHDTCTGKHGWTYMCTAHHRKFTWGIDIRGVNTCK